MLITPQNFYKEYSCDFHEFKQRLNSDILNNTLHYENRLYGKELEEENRKSLIFYIRSEIRQTFIHSVETLFELIFAFEPSEKGQLYDKKIVERLTFSNWRKNYKRIDKFAEDVENLNFLDVQIDAYGSKTTLFNYLFYPNLDMTKEPFAQHYEATVKTVKKGLHIIAKEFSEREDYNAIKHALRGVSAMKSIMIGEADTFKKVMEWDVQNSMTYYQKNESNKNEIEVVTKQFHSDFDLKMTYFTSYLIQNMILIRDAIFRKKDTQVFGGFTVNFFNEDIINEAIDSKSGIIHFKITIPRTIV